ncbi:hypothetical protein, partial [Enterobacter hormaechei]
LKSVIVPSVQSPPSMLKLHDFCNRALSSMWSSGDFIVQPISMMLRCRKNSKTRDSFLVA